MPLTDPGGILTSIPTSRLDIASAITTDIELKLDWEDYDVLSGTRSLSEVLDENNVELDRITSVHLPPGVRTRGRDIGMAATKANVGAILDFVHTQLVDLPDVFLVVHPPRQFDYGEQLTLFQELCDLTGHEITVENPPDESYWYTPEDIAFFGFVGATYSDWKDLYVTVDGKHLPANRSAIDSVDRDATTEIFDRVDQVSGLDRDSLEKAFHGHLTGNIAEYQPDNLERLSHDGWSPLLKVLVLTADRVKSVHFNDPIDDGVPDLAGHGDQPTLDAIREILFAENIFLVLEPDRETYDRPDEFSQKVKSVENWLGTSR